MALVRYGSAKVVIPNISQDKWLEEKFTSKCKTAGCQVKTAKTVFARYNPKKYLLSHCSIMAAVETELADRKNPKSDYLIRPEFSKFVNNNGDAWSKRMLQASYKSFVGCNNYLEHVQIPELAKGKVVDAVLREVPIGKDKEGKEQTTFYVDILVATDRKHGELVRKIEANEMDSLSMGCVISYSICSKCGNRAKDETDACQHVRYEKNNVFYDDNGIQRKVAELCGHFDEPESVRFVDASWVINPAFTGAVVRNLVKPSENIMAKIENANKQELYKVKETDYLKAASDQGLIAADPPIPLPEEAPAEEAPVEEALKKAPKKEEEVEEAPVEETPEEAPVEDVPAETPADETLEEDPAAPPAPPVEEEDPVQKIKTDIKNKVLEEIKDDIVNEFSGDEDSDRPRELETLDENLIHPTAVLKEMWTAKKAWDGLVKRKAGKLSTNNFNKLRYGSYILMTSGDLSELSNYGYNKREFLAVMSFLDSCFKNPLDIKVKKAVARLGGSDDLAPLDLVRSLVRVVGRRLSSEEAKRSVLWLNLMDSYKE